MEGFLQVRPQVTPPPQSLSHYIQEIHRIEEETHLVSTGILGLLKQSAGLRSSRDLMEALLCEHSIRLKAKHALFDALIARSSAEMSEIAKLTKETGKLAKELRQIQSKERPAPRPRDRIEEDKYDWSIEIESLKAVLKDGWTVDGRDIFEPWVTVPMISPTETSDLHCGNPSSQSDGAVVAVVGLFNKGKTFLLNALTASSLPSSLTTHTKGLSFKRVEMDSWTHLTLLDTAGSLSPMKISPDFSISDKEATELFILDLVLDLSDYFICVVSDFTSLDQRYLEKVCRYLRSAPGRSFREVIVVHNLRDVEDAEVLEHVWKKQVREMLGQGMEQSTLVAANDRVTDRVEAHLVSWVKTEFTRHIYIVNDNSDFGISINPWSISLLKYWLKAVVVPVPRTQSLVQKTINLMKQKLSWYCKMQVNLELRPGKERGKLVLWGKTATEKELIITKIDPSAGGLMEIQPDSFVPMIDIVEGDDYIIYIDLPGVRIQDLTITRQSSHTLVQGRKGQDPLCGVWIRKERPEGEFKVCFRIPEHYENKWYSAELQQGVLSIKYRKDRNDSDSCLL